MAGTYYAGSAAEFNAAIASANADPGSTIVITGNFNAVNPTASTQPLNIVLGYQGVDHRLGISGLQAGTNSLTFTDTQGAGFATLTGTNTFGSLSTTFLTLSTDGSAALGAGPLNIYSCTLVPLNTSTTINQNIALNYSGVSIDTAPGYTLTLAGQISGASGADLFFVNNGTTTLSGANTFAGTAYVQAGIVNAQNSAALGTNAGGTVVSNGATLQLQNNITIGGEPLSLAGAGFANNEGALENVSGNNTFGGTATLTGTTRINSDAGVLTLNAANAVTGNYNLTLGGSGNGLIAGTITTGADTVTKDGTGTWTLSATDTYSGDTTVSAGTLLVDGSILNSTTIVETNGTLGGSGTTGEVQVQSGGTLSPGDSPGILNTGRLVFASAATYVEQIGGATAGNGDNYYDQTNVTGTVSLGGATLRASFVNGFVPSAGQSYTIIQNDLQDPVVGNFVDANGNALTEGSSVAVNGVNLVISYKGGDGNDVTLTDPASSSSTPAGPTPGDDNLAGTDGNDSISLLAGNDTYSGLYGNDLIYGNQGNDLVYGNQGNDLIYGGQDNDTAFGGQGDDTLFGNAGNDVAYGNIGNDLVYGNQGDDRLFGGQGNDTLYGGMGNDVLFGNKGDDVLVGGVGSDTFGFNLGDTDFQPNVGTGDTVADFVSGTDKIDFTAGPTASAANFGSGAVVGGSFAQLQAAAQQLISGGKVYAFETDGVNGYLFTSAGGPAGTIEDAVKMAGANAATSVKATDIAGGPVPAVA